MNHKAIITIISILIVTGIVGGAVHFKRPKKSLVAEQPSEQPTPTTTLIAATSSLLRSIPEPTIGPPQAEAEPTIAWTPASVIQTILAGESETVIVLFTATENLTNVIVRVVPELAPYVQTSPASFASIAKSQVASLNLVISAPADALPKVIDGVVQVRSDTDAPETFAKPLPITLEVLTASVLPTPFAHPTAITVGQPTTMVVAVNINDPNLVTDSVKLLRIDNSGRTLAILGVLQDDGKNGDTIAADNFFTTKVLINEPFPGELRLRVSAELLNAGKPGLSHIISIPIYINHQTPESAIADFKRALTQKDAEGVSNLLTPNMRSNVRQALAAMSQNGTLIQFFEELNRIEETHRTDDYVEFQFVRLEDGEPTTYNLYLWNIHGIGWKFNGL